MQPREARAAGSRQQAARTGVKVQTKPEGLGVAFITVALLVLVLELGLNLGGGSSLVRGVFKLYLYHIWNTTFIRDIT